MYVKENNNNNNMYESYEKKRIEQQGHTNHTTLFPITI